MANNSPFSWQNGVDTTNSNIALNLAGIPANPFINNTNAVLNVANSIPQTAPNINVPQNKVFMPELGIQPQQQTPTATQPIQAKFSAKSPQLSDAKVQSIYNAYVSGQMDSESASQYEKDVQSGAVRLPFTADATQFQVQPATENTNPNNLPVFNAKQSQELPKSVVDAYNNGTMTADDRASLEQDLKDKVISLPKDTKLKDYSKPAIKLTPEQIAYINTDPAPYDNAEQAKQAKQIRIQNVTNDIVEQNKSVLQKAVESVVGAGEAGLTLATGATSGFAGTLVDAINGKKPNEAGLGETLTYQPKTQKGQKYAQNVSNLINESGITGLAPNLSEVGSLANAIKSDVGAIKNVIPKAVKNIDIVAQEAEQARQSRVPVSTDTTGATEVNLAELPNYSDKVQSETIITKANQAINGDKKALGELKLIVKDNPEILDTAKDIEIQNIINKKSVSPETQTYLSGLSDSAGAMRTSDAVLRQYKSENLPVPIPLTKGQATRDFGQLQFEKETAKNAELGQPLRDQADYANNAIVRNFEQWIDDTGAKALTNTETGQAVVGAIQKDLDKYKNQIRVAYKDAEKAGELKAPVSTQNISNFLEESKSAEALAPVLKGANDELSRLQKIAQKENPDLQPNELRLSDVEKLRKFVNAVQGNDPTNLKYAKDIRNVIDQTTEGKGGELYAKARALRVEQAQRYENRAVISDLVANKKNMADKKVALEDVFNSIVIQGSADDLKFTKRILQTAGEEGNQAFKEIRGSTLRHILDEATKGVNRNSAGEQVVSTAQINKIIKSLDRDGKLDILYGKKNAEQLRDLNDLIIDVTTAPSGAINTSNTGAIIAALVDSIVSVVSGLPVPIASTVRLAIKMIKNKKLKARIQEALNYKAQ